MYLLYIAARHSFVAKWCTFAPLHFFVLFLCWWNAQNYDLIVYQSLWNFVRRWIKTVSGRGRNFSAIEKRLNRLWFICYKFYFIRRFSVFNPYGIWYGPFLLEPGNTVTYQVHKNSLNIFRPTQLFHTIFLTVEGGRGSLVQLGEKWRLSEQYGSRGNSDMHG